ncbi:hypothetical protein FHS82_004122 [Pseudochelatococcus lubricantis]|uniref:Uncharacterized protein n=1 Tax=Pseudochelatococcus lubricantis TaxID=1538102 RepID=A0ABX0V5L7_9HYPH|nr:hypothetical protein [Pseudochelatococcus lubricantis]
MSTSDAMVLVFLAPRGRPLGLPLWPGLNWVWRGGR